MDEAAEVHREEFFALIGELFDFGDSVEGVNFSAFNGFFNEEHFKGVGVNGQVGVRASVEGSFEGGAFACSGCPGHHNSFVAGANLVVSVGFFIFIQKPFV